MNFLEAVAQLTRQNYMSSPKYRIKMQNCGILMSEYTHSSSPPPFTDNWYWTLWRTNIYETDIFLATDWELKDRRSENGGRRAESNE